jgi:hypothetical protein
VEPEETVVARDRLYKHVYAITSTHAAKEELLVAVFSVRSVPRLHKESTLSNSAFCHHSVFVCSVWF